MFKRILGSACYRTDKLLRDVFHAHGVFREARWNRLEKIILFCSAHYIKSIGFLFSGFVALFTLLYFLKPSIKPLAEQYAPAWKTLFDWQTSLLGGQLTIIGIVYPLVVGLVSVIFQKKSTRKIVQAAYQRYSGFMFAGLSGLFLAAFILTGSITRPFISNYSYAILCGMSILWMLLNIGLSIWFFIQSICVLDDVHRERMVFRYLVSDVLIPTIRDRILQGFLRQPVRHHMLNAEIFQAIRLYDNDSGHGYQTIRKHGVDIWYRPLMLLLKRLDTRLARKNQQISLLFFPRDDVVSGNDRKSIFEITGGEIGGGYRELLRACFRIGERKSPPVNQEVLIKGVSGDTYDALCEGDINAFEDAVQNMCRAFSRILNVFQYSSPQGNQNLLLISDGIFEDSFVEKFYAELYLLFRQAMLKIDASDRFFARSMQIPQLIYGMRDRVTLKENQLGLMYTYYVWETLMDWGHVNHLRMTLSQRQIYEQLITKFVELWESWLDVIMYKNTLFPDARLFHGALRKHLLTLPLIVVSSVRSGDSFAVSWAIDLLHRWTDKLRLDSDDYINYSAQQFFTTPESISSTMPNDQAYRNAQVDIRLCTAAFLIHQATEDPMLNVENAVQSLLTGSLNEETGIVDNCSLSITSGQHIIDIYLRIYLLGGRHLRSKPGWLEGLIGELSAANGKPMISGRVYMGNRLTDVGDLITAFVQLGIMMSSSAFQVSQTVKQSLEGDMFDYREKEKVAYVLNAMREHTDQQTQFALPHQDDFGACKDRFQQTLAAYCDAVVQSKRQDIEKAGIDEDRLVILGHNVSILFREKLKTHFLTTLFSSTQFCNKTDDFEEKTVISISDKEYYARGIKTSPIHNEDSYWADNALQIIWNDVLSTQLRRDAECNMQVAHFADILTFVCESDTVDNGSKLVVSGRAFFDEYQAWHYENSAAVDAMLSFDKSDNKYLKTSKGLCRLIFAPGLDLHCAILTDDSYFDHLSIAESTKGDIITLSGRPVPDNPYHIKLHMTYSIQERYHGNIRMRFQRNEN